MPERIDTGKILHNVARTDEYLQYRQRAEILNKHRSSEETLQAKQKAIDMGALALANFHTAEKGYVSSEAALYQLTGRLNSFSRHQSWLDQNEDLPRSQKLPHLEEVAHFNYALKQAIDTNAKAGRQGILKHMTDAYQVFNGSESASIFEDQARRALVGMQHERAHEQIIELTGIYQIDYDRQDVGEEQSVIDDLNGDDIFVIDTTDNTHFSIDTKASPETVRKAKLKSRTPDKIVWSQCNNEDFTNSFTIDPVIARRKAMALIPDLDAAAAAVRGRHIRSA